MFVTGSLCLFNSFVNKLQTQVSSQHFLCTHWVRAARRTRWAAQSTQPEPRLPLRLGWRHQRYSGRQSTLALAQQKLKVHVYKFAMQYKRGGFVAEVVDLATFEIGSHVSRRLQQSAQQLLGVAETVCDAP